MGETPFGVDDIFAEYNLMMTATDSPRIYVACLAAYNNGKLHGEWIDAAQDADDIQEAVTKMLAASPEPDAEEWAIHDYEGFMGFPIEEWTGFEKIAEVAQALEEHGEAYALYVQNTGDDDVSNFEDAYAGCHPSELSYAEDLFDEIYLPDVPASVRYYIDYEAFSRDLFINDYFSMDGSEGTHVYRNQ